MRVSVVLATYNQPQWLEKVLWGYALQTFGGFELLVADDGSGPEAAETIRSFQRRVATHVRRVEPGKFLSGGAFRLPLDRSRAGPARASVKPEGTTAASVPNLPPRT